MVIKGQRRAASTPSSESSKEGNTLQAELSAMRDIAVALTQLDEPTRARVLHWAEERFRGDAPVVAPPAPLYAITGGRPSSDPGKVADESLSVSTLDDFFDPRGPKVLKDPATEAPGQSVTGMLNDFVVEFQDIVREWNVACSGPTDGHTVAPALSVVSERTRSQRASKAK